MSWELATTHTSLKPGDEIMINNQTFTLARRIRDDLWEIRYSTGKLYKVQILPESWSSARLTLSLYDDYHGSGMFISPVYHRLSQLVNFNN